MYFFAIGFPVRPFSTDFGQLSGGKVTCAWFGHVDGRYFARGWDSDYIDVVVDLCQGLISYWSHVNCAGAGRHHVGFTRVGPFRKHAVVDCIGIGKCLAHHVAHILAMLVSCMLWIGSRTKRCDAGDASEYFLIRSIPLHAEECSTPSIEEDAAGVLGKVCIAVVAGIHDFAESTASCRYPN